MSGGAREFNDLPVLHSSPRCYCRQVWEGVECKKNTSFPFSLVSYTSFIDQLREYSHGSFQNTDTASQHEPIEMEWKNKYCFQSLMFWCLRQEPVPTNRLRQSSCLTANMIIRTHIMHWLLNNKHWSSVKLQIMYHMHQKMAACLIYSKSAITVLEHFFFHN